MIIPLLESPEKQHRIMMAKHSLCARHLITFSYHPGKMAVWASFMLTYQQARVIGEEGASTENNASIGSG